MHLLIQYFRINPKTDVHRSISCHDVSTRLGTPLAGSDGTSSVGHKCLESGESVGAPGFLESSARVGAFESFLVLI